MFTTEHNTIYQQANKEFMLKEHERVYMLMLDESRQAEQRVAFFITMASAVIAAFALLAQTSQIPDQILSPAIQGILIVLFLYGLTTLNRINARDIQNKAYGRLLAQIQNCFAESDPKIKVYIETRLWRRPPCSA
jgi:hypothetical protein